MGKESIFPLLAPLPPPPAVGVHTHSSHEEKEGILPSSFLPLLPLPAADLIMIAEVQAGKNGGVDTTAKHTKEEEENPLV